MIEIECVVRGNIQTYIKVLEKHVLKYNLKQYIDNAASAKRKSPDIFPFSYHKKEKKLMKNEIENV